MDRNSFFGGSVLGILVRLSLLSIVVGIVLSALGITPQDFFHQIDNILKNLYQMGFGAVEWVLKYFLLGAMVVVPIWLISRLFGVLKSRRDDAGV